MTDKPFPHIPYSIDRLAPAEMLAKGREFRDQANKRRSVRDFSDEKVPREAIDLAIETANTAPSGANFQPWHFAVVDDPTLKEKIREAAEQEERAFYEGRAPDEWLEALAPIGTDWRKPFLETAPFLIVVFQQLFGYRDDGSKRKYYYTSESVGLACGMLLTALHQMGLATLTHTPSPMGFLSDILERPKNEKAFLLIPVGYPADDCTVPDIHRKSLSEISSNNV